MKKVKTITEFVNSKHKSNFEESASTNNEAIELVHAYKNGILFGTGELIKVKGKKSFVEFDTEHSEWFDNKDVKLVESVIGESRRIQTKRKYTEKYPAKNVGKFAKVRNKILDAINDGKMSQHEFDKIVSELSSDSKRWMRKNNKLFNISEDGVALSKFGKRILSGITVNESFELFVDGLYEEDI